MSYERVVAIRKAPSGHGFQYEVKLAGRDETQWEAASRMKRQVPQLVAAFEELQRQSSDTAEEEGEQQDAGEGEQSIAEALAGELNEQRAYVEEQGLAIAELKQQLQQQKQQLDKQSRAMAADKQSPNPGASPKHSPQLSPAAAPRAIKKEPRLSDLAEYSGAGGDKLDAWLAELRRCARYYQMAGPDAVEFAVARLRDSADTWWASLPVGAQQTITSVEMLSAALRSRFQPVTTARMAREKLHGLQQGVRGVDDYIADFNKLYAQVPDMSEPDARAQFVRGLRRDLAAKMEDIDWEELPLATVVAKAARAGARTGALPPTAASRSSSVNSLEMDGGHDDHSTQSARLLERMEATLNALQQSAGASTGIGAKTQAKRAYAKQRQQHQNQSRPAPSIQIPGVPEEVLQQRWVAKVCLRCGQDGHRSMACPNGISSSN